MKKLLLSLTLAFMSAAAVLAQGNALIKFDEVEHNYGTQKEEDGPLKHAFRFTNTSTGPVKLTYVKASCGCTTPSWSQEVIQPGGTGFVHASYDTRNRPGAFTKTITVKAGKVLDAAAGTVDSTSQDIKILTIKGDITPRTKGPADWYPFESGSLRFSRNHISFNEITNKEKKTDEIVIYNQGKKQIDLGQLDVKPHITFEFPQGKSVRPGDSIRTKVTYDATQVTDWDFLHERATVKTNDDTLAEKTFYISATVVPHIDNKDTLNGPRIKFNKLTHDYGEMNADQKYSTTFEFTNTGKQELKIHKVKASCGCTATQPEKTLLKPGETSKIDVTFNPYGKKGDQMKTITVISNDPKDYKTTLTIKGNVKETAGDAQPAGGGH